MTAGILVDEITSPTTLIFASIFFTLSIVCVIGNVLALIGNSQQHGIYST